MIQKIKACYLVTLFAVFISPPAALAMPTITCHCFKDRSYDPARPSVADAYLLATAQNSFFAHLFGSEQREIVMKKRTGTPAEDLWVAYWVAGKAGISPDDLLNARRRKTGWNDLIFPLQLPPNTLGTHFVRELRANAPNSRLAEAVVDELFAQYRLLDRPALAAMRKAGATNQELILATMIGAKSGQPAGRLLLEVRRNRSSWGKLLHDARIDPGKFKEELATLLKKTRS